MQPLPVWISCLLASGLAATTGAAPPVVDQKWENLPNGVLGQPAEFEGIDGVKIAGYVRKPAGDGPFPLVIVLHGSGPIARPASADNEPARAEKAAQEAAQASAALGRASHPPIPDFLAQGWAVYYIDYRPNPRYKIDPLEFDDTVIAFNKARTFPFVDPKRIAMYGGSHGGHVTARMASRVSLCCALPCAPAGIDLIALFHLTEEGVPIGGNQGLIREMESRSRVKMAEIEKHPETYHYSSLLTEASQVKCPMFLISGKNDPNAPLPVIEAYADALRAAGKEVETYHPDNGPHGFETALPHHIPETDEATRQTIVFLKKHFERANASSFGGLASGKPAVLDMNVYREVAKKYKSDAILLEPADKKYVDSLPLTSDFDALKTIVPLTELGTNLYKGQDGGLYGGGNNVPPLPHLAAYLKQCQQIQPLDAEGNPSKAGKIVLLCIGFSNPMMEFTDFKPNAERDPQKASSVVLVNASVGGMAGADWAKEEAARLPVEEQKRIEKALKDGAAKSPDVKIKQNTQCWAGAEAKLKAAGVTPAQVQVIWTKQVEAFPANFGEFPGHSQLLQDDIRCVVYLAKKHYPNLRVAYLTSRTYAGYTMLNASPEPYAYETAFAVRGVIQDQIKGHTMLNYDPARGPVNAPVLVWGPYFWANGLTPRKSDGLVWRREDCKQVDGLHPSALGKQKTTSMMLNFFTTDPGARLWFAKE